MSYYTTTRALFLRFSIWRKRSYIVLVIFQTLSVFLLCEYLDVPFESSMMNILLWLLKILVPTYFISLMLCRYRDMITYVRPKKPLQWFLNDLRNNVFELDKVASFIIALTLISVYAGSFVVAKDLIPHINPFSWDPFFSALDKALHGGNYPWRLSHAAIGHPYITTVINFFYHLWLGLMYFAIIHACYNISKSENHAAFLVSTVLTWAIVGGVLATVFSSVGPVYYQAFGFGDTYEPLMDTLRSSAQISPVMALEIQEMLLGGYFNDGPNRGISAMPSMHVASSVLIALYGFTISRWLGWSLTAFAVIIQIGSVHLAWHYAIDGYFAAILAFACWKLSQILVRKYG